MEKIELGDRVKDRISGLKGIVYGITDWLYSCRRISVLPEEFKDGKPAEFFSTDEPQLKIVRKGAIVPPPPPAAAVPAATGGPRGGPSRAVAVSAGHDIARA